MLPRIIKYELSIDDEEGNKNIKKEQYKDLTKLFDHN